MDTVLEEAISEIRRLRDGLFDLESHTSPDGEMADRAVNQAIRHLLKMPQRWFSTVVS